MIVSCNKEQHSPVVSKSKTIENFEKIGEQTDQRMAFNLMTIQEKELVVAKHLSFCVQYFHLNTAQIQILKEVKANLHAIFSSENPENSPLMIQLEEDIQTHFSNLDPYTQSLIFDSMVDSEEDISNMPVGNPNAATNCTCSPKSNWCSGWGQGSVVNCNTSKCNMTHSSGCGTFWSYACNGKCTIGN